MLDGLFKDNVEQARKLEATITDDKLRRRSVTKHCAPTSHRIDPSHRRLAVLPNLEARAALEKAATPLDPNDLGQRGPQARRRQARAGKPMSRSAPAVLLQSFPRGIESARRAGAAASWAPRLFGSACRCARSAVRCDRMATVGGGRMGSWSTSTLPLASRN
jgi:hypothetical protein